MNSGLFVRKRVDADNGKFYMGKIVDRLDMSGMVLGMKVYGRQEPAN